MTVNSRIIKTFLNWSPHAVDVPLNDGLRIQIVPTMADLSRARKHQFAAFVVSDALLVVWEDDANKLIPRATAIEKQLMELVWKTEKLEGSGEEGEGKQAASNEVPGRDVEKGERMEDRPTILINTINVGLTLFLVVVMLGLGFRAIITEVMIDSNFTRVAFIAMTPVQVFFTLVRNAWLRLDSIANNTTVLRASCGRLRCSDHWPCQTSSTEL